ncbi:hypothetical protein H0V99_00405 [Candidatus Saccharibacteria bacterium]|nr:hypothetical protein [Candidatus Saccharibacteria bacterium]
MDEAIMLTDKLRHRAKDNCDNPGAAQAADLKELTELLYTETKQNKDPDALFVRVKEVEQHVQDLRATEGIYSLPDVNDMYDRCQELKQLFKELA